MILSSQSSADGRLRGSGGSEGSRLARMFTNRVMLGPAGCRKKGSFDASLMRSRAGQIMISDLNGSFFAIAVRRVDSLTFSRTTKVPTAPMFMTPNFANCLAMTVGWHRLALPTLTARRNTTQGIGADVTQNLSG